MAVLTAVYLDFRDAASHRVWRWLSLLPERHTVEIRPFSGEREPGGQRNPWDRTEPSWSVELLALGEIARETGREAHERLVDAAFSAVHQHDGRLSPEEWLRIGAAAGLDLEAFAADGERWRAEVGLWHQEAEDELGVTRAPSLVFGSEASLFVMLEHDVPDRQAAQRLLADLTDLAAQPVEVVRRTS